MAEWREEGMREWRRRVFERELRMLLWLWKTRIERVWEREVLRVLGLLLQPVAVGA